MKRSLSSCLAIATIALIAPRPAVAAAILINDALNSENITFSMNDFEGGFFLDGSLRQQGLNNPQSITLAEVNAAGAPIIHTFSADWITGGLVPMSAVIAFVELGINPATGVSDILTFTYSAGALGGHLVGTFQSDVDPGLLPLPAGATVVPETAAGFAFNNGNITAIARSDLEAVPEPASIVIFGTALVGFGWLRRRKKAA